MNPVHASSTLKPHSKSVANAGTAPTRWHGALEGMHGGLVYGWAVDGEAPARCVVLEILRDGDTVGTVTADVARGDLASELAIHGAHGVCHGFVADLGIIKTGQAGIVTARIANSATLLPGYLELAARCEPPAAAHNAVFSDGALRLHGWAAGAYGDTRKLTVSAYLGQQLLAQTVADLAHPAVRSSGIDYNGFTLNLPPSLGDGHSRSVRVVDEHGRALNGSPVIVCCYANGGKTLLPLAEDGVLASVIDGYERILPRSLGMEHYPQWRALFETAAGFAVTLPKGMAGLVGIIIIPTGVAEALRLTLDSLESQRNKELCVYTAGDGETFADQVHAALDAGCKLLACIRAGDTLAPHALACMLQAFAAPEVQLAYSDSEYGGQPWFKPAWNAEYALASDYPLDLLFARAGPVRALAPTSLVTPASLAWSLLATHWRKASRAIAHVPRILLHGGAPFSEQELQQRLDAAAAALRSVEPRSRLQVLPAEPGSRFLPRRVLRPIGKRERQNRVTLIIPTRDRVELVERCIATIGLHTDWPDLEIIVVDNDSVLPRTKAYFRKLTRQGVKVLPCPGQFNFAMLNNTAVAAASGGIIGLINNDIEAMHDGWLDEMVSHLLRPEVGAVGAKLLWPNNMVQHGGVLLGVGNVAGHFGNRLADGDWGDHGRNQLLQQVSGVTAACLLLRKRDYLAVGGMDEAAFPVAFNDVDLCLKLRRAGKTIVWTPYARLLHAESASRGHEDTPQKRARAQREIDQLRARWGHALLHDPAYHPSLNLDPHSHAYGGLALPPRCRSPRLAGLRQED